MAPAVFNNEYEWRPIYLESGVSPWCRKQTGQALWLYKETEEPVANPLRGIYDYTASLDRTESHLLNIVYDVLAHTHIGAEVRACYRLCENETISRRLVSSDEVYSVPQLEENGPQGPPVQLAKTLRPDQENALHFVTASETAPKLQKSVFQAFARMIAGPIVVGGHARLMPSFRGSTLDSHGGANFLALSAVDMLHVLQTPGEVLSKSYHSHEFYAMVKLHWSFPEGGFLDLSVSQGWLEGVSLWGRLSPGSCVRLRRKDDKEHVGCEDVGIIMECTEENVVVSFPQCYRWKGRLSDLEATTETLKKRYVEVHVAVVYECFGSVCAQRMGWGKTPLMIALIKSRLEEASSQDKRDTTLIIVPPKVFRQWVNEMKLWLGILSESGTSMTTKDRKLTVWMPVDMADFKALDGDVASLADVVILSHKILEKLPLPSEVPDSQFDIYSRQWTRVILDEAHEIPFFSRRTQERLLSLQHRAVHLLSGTPQQGAGSRGAASLALLFKASLCPSCPMKPGPPQFYFDGDMWVRAAARSFFTTFARTQESPFKLPVTEHVVKVQLTEAERVLYANMIDHERPTTREKLEKCCCFVTETTSANKEIGVLIKKKTRDLERKLQEAKGSAALVILLAESLGGDKLTIKRKTLKCSNREERVDYWQEGRRLVDGLYAELAGLSSENLTELVLRDPVNVWWHGGVSKKFLMEEGMAANPKEILRRLHSHHYSQAQVKDLFQEQAESSVLCRDFVSLGSIKKPLDFLKRSMEELASGGSCPICLDGLKNGEVTCMTSCGHAFHESCMQDVLKMRPECPNCRQQVTSIFATEPPVPMDPWLKYGTKVQTMIKTLKQIRADCPGERLLLFVQYRNTRQKLEKAFAEFDVPFLTLCGSTRSQGKAVTRWQSGGDPKDFLMMLSCEEHNSGITLTRARHIMLAHPFDALSREEAADMEKQALGRINRIGQTAASLVLWRVITEGTIEEELYEQERHAEVKRPACKRRRVA
jgi:hypothetical protein